MILKKIINMTYVGINEDGDDNNEFINVVCIGNTKLKKKLSWNRTDGLHTS